MSEELKLCPFCGSTALIDEHPAHSHAGGIAAFMPDYPGSFTLECMGKDCNTGLIVDTRAEVVAMWNRRAAPASEPAEGVPIKYGAALIALDWQADTSLYVKEADMLTFGAQQREAGRREGREYQSKVFDKIRARKDARIAELEVEAATRQPVSALTDEQIAEFGYSFCIQAFEDARFRDSQGQQMTAPEWSAYKAHINFARALLAASPAPVSDAEPLSFCTALDAAGFIDAKAQKYLDDHSDTEHDTGATVFHYGEAGRDYHSNLVELAEELRSQFAATPPAPQAAGEKP